MVDEPALLERGVLTTPAEVWDLAVRRAEVIGQLATGATVGHVAADAAAVELGVSRRQVYAMLARWRAGSGLASDPVPGRSSGGRGRELLRGLADLGAEVHDDEARTFGDGFGDLHGHLVNEGSNTISRQVHVPSTLKPGDYEIAGEIWENGKAGAAGADTIDDATCGTITVK